MQHRGWANDIELARDIATFKASWWEELCTNPVPLERGDRALATPVNQDYVQDGQQYTNLEFGVAKVNGRLGLTLFKSDCKRYWRIEIKDNGGGAEEPQRLLRAPESY